jgi:hypothetical protein
VTFFLNSASSSGDKNFAAARTAFVITGLGSNTPSAWKFIVKLMTDEDTNQSYKSLQERVLPNSPSQCPSSLKTLSFLRS